MSRTLAFTILLACLAAAAAAQPARAPADPPADKKPAAKEQPTAAAPLPTPRSLVLALTSPVTFAGEKDPKRTLVEVLDALTKQHNVPYTINEAAFKFEMVPEVGKTEVAVAAVPPMRATLGKVIARILARVPVPSGATFLVREDGIEITTGQYVAAEIAVERRQPAKPTPAAAGPGPGKAAAPAKQPAKPPLPAAGGGPGVGLAPGLGGAAGLGLGGGFAPGVSGVIGIGSVEEEKKFNVAVVSVAVERQPLEEALRQMRSQANVNFVLDPGLGEKARTAVTITLLNAPLDSALEVLTEMVELDFVWLDNIFYVTTRDKAQKLRTTWPGRRSGGAAHVVSEAAPGGM